MKNFVMKRFMTTLLLAASYASGAEGQTCMRPGHTQAFNVIALKSALMVGALSCNQGEQYNAFMADFQTYILAEQHTIDDYFIRANGLAGQAQEDAYETSLANSQSQMSLALGGGFCQANNALFNQVLALQTPAGLDKLLAADPPAEPIAMTACAPAKPALPRRPAETIAAAPGATETAKAAAALTVNEPPIHQMPLRAPASARQAHNQRHLPPPSEVTAKKPPSHPAPMYLASQTI